MKATGAEVVIKALREQRVRWLFGIPGTHNIELFDAFLDAEDIMPVLITDEQSSGFMADGMARATGEMAALNLVPGAGLTHAMSGISECFLDQIPLLVLVCGVRKDIDKSYQLHDVNQCDIVRPVSKAVFSPQTHAELYQAITKACIIANQSPPGPTVVEVPVNLYFSKGDITADNLRISPSEFESPPTNVSAIKKAAEVINRAERILLYVGLGAKGLESDLVELAEKLNAVVFTTISGKGVFPENNPRFCWNTLGRAAPKQFQKIENSADLVLAIGCRFSEVGTASYGLTQPKTLIHVDVDTNVFNKNYKSALSIQSDAGVFIKTLLPLLTSRASAPIYISEVSDAHVEVKSEQQQIGNESKVHPGLLLNTLQKQCGPETLFVTDSGNGTFLAMENLKLPHGNSFLAPVDYSCMGYCIPAAIGAKLGAPNRNVVALAGDGAFLMTGLELLTAKQYEASVMVFVLRDRELSQIAQFQKASLNRLNCTELTEYSLQHLAQGMGIDYLELRNNSQIESIVSMALDITKNKRPVIVEVNIDYSKPTYFSRGVVKTNFLRFGWKDRFRLVSRVVGRKVLG